jgi:tetratricopeptide (TPR) repeat protein
MRSSAAAPRSAPFGSGSALPIRPPLLGRKRRYDRSKLLADAASAQRKGKLRKAAALYREVLAVEPGNVDLERKLAPLLAKTRQRDEAWASYKRAAEGLANHGMLDQAVGVYRECAQLLPRQGELWLALANLEVKRGRKPDAVKALLDGATKLRGRKERALAVRLLERARELEPADFEVGFALAGRLARTGKRERALKLLEELAVRKSGRVLRRVRGRQLFLAPGPGTAWRWIRAFAS